MKKILALLILATFTLAPIRTWAAGLHGNGLLSPEQIEALESLPPDEFYKAKVASILSEKEDIIDDFKAFSQKIRVQILSGAEDGKVLDLDYGGLKDSSDPKRLKEGDAIVVIKNYTLNGPVYYVNEKYRLSSMGFLFFLFFALAILLAGIRGLGAFLGLMFSIGVIMFFILPRVVNGADPLITSFMGACIIALIALFVAHGFNRRTSVAVVSTLITLVLSTGLAVFFVKMARLFGTGSEESFLLQLNPYWSIDLQGLFLGAIIIGALGVLDDVTTAQTAAIEELHRLKPSLKFHELYAKGISIGREHISSLINTLALAYVGASFPLLLIFYMNQNQPIWMILNSEYIAEEIIRTLIGSVTLMLAVPISTALAAGYFSRLKVIKAHN